ncbi:ribonuclease catalytic domain-containing protein [Candidatus Riflebacteria bacterium]
MSENIGKIIEIIEDGTLILCQIIQESKNKFIAHDKNGKTRRLSEKQIILSHNQADNPETFPENLIQIQNKIEPLKREIETELLWESLQDDLRTYTIEELAEQYFAKTNSYQESALFHVLLTDPIHFKIKGKNIIPRTLEQVDEQKLVERRNIEKEELRKNGVDWIKKILKTENPEEIMQEAPEITAILCQCAKDFLRKNGGRELLNYLPQQGNLAYSAKEVAFEILKRTGKIPQDSDPFLVISGIDEHFQDEIINEANKLSPFVPDQYFEDFSTLNSFTIDEDETREIDDALSLQQSGDFFSLGIHIAFPSHFFVKDSIIDREAFNRSLSLYLPGRTVTMLPQRISCDLASLNQEKLRPCLSFLINFSPEKNILNWDIKKGILCVKKRLTYDDVDRLIESNGNKDFKILDQLAQELENRRKSRGALIVRRPEIKIKVLRDGELELQVRDRNSPAQRIVTEMMILANNLTAEFAVKEKIPIIFRCQEPPDIAVQIPDTYEPLKIEEIFKQIKPSQYSIFPNQHSGLGLNTYTQLTSPLRRYADLIIHRQLMSFLFDSSIQYEVNELVKILGASEVVTKENRSIENRANRFYILKYLQKKQIQATLDATVIKKHSNHFIIETIPWPIRGKLISNVQLSPGEKIEVRIAEIIPQRNILNFTRV